MPTTYTHYAYGQEVFHKLPEELQRKIEPYIEYYNIGVHGPDILFYYHSYCKNKVNQYGVKVHHEPAREFFKRAFKVFQAQKNRNEAFAYLAGFMTHFILDSSCHPYVRKRIKETGDQLYFPFWIWSKESDYNSDWRICQSRIRSASSFYSKRNQSSGCRNL